MIKIPFVDLKAQYLSIKPEIDEAIFSVINETSFIKGYYVDKFEKEYAEKYGVRHCIGVANGTDAIYIVLKMLGIGEGDEVITTSLSWISTSETISLTGAKPVFVDIDDYYTIDASKIEEKITDRTKAIIPVHLYGQPCEMDEIMQIAEKYGLYVVEDCAQAHFAKYKGKYVGTFGIAGTFSFYPGKNLGAYGDAGAIITNDNDLALKCRMYANHGSLKKHEHQIEGINSRLDGLQAAILSVKLKYIEKWNQSRYEKAKLYSELLKDMVGVITPKVRDCVRHVFHIYAIQTKGRDKLMVYLKEKGITTQIHYPRALPFLQAYKRLGYRGEDLPLAFSIPNELLSLPMYPELSESQIEYVVDKIKEFMKTHI